MAIRWQDHIVATPDTLHGAPRFRGTRIPVSVVLDNLAAGIKPEDLYENYPTLPPCRVSSLASASLHGGRNDHRKRRSVFVENVAIKPRKILGLYEPNLPLPVEVGGEAARFRGV